MTGEAIGVLRQASARHRLCGTRAITRVPVADGTLDHAPLPRPPEIPRHPLMIRQGRGLPRRHPPPGPNR